MKLPFAALLGETESSLTHHQLFLVSIWRVAVGTISLSLIAVPFMKIAAYIAYSYSARRLVGVEGLRRPILSFRTQQLPVYTTIAQAGVLGAFAHYAANFFSDADVDMRIRHAIATCAKAVMISAHQTASILLSDRCGAQGLFNFNQICKAHVSGEL